VAPLNPIQWLKNKITLITVHGRDHITRTQCILLYICKNYFTYWKKRWSGKKCKFLYSILSILNGPCSGLYTAAIRKHARNWFLKRWNIWVFFLEKNSLTYILPADFHVTNIMVLINYFNRLLEVSLLLPQTFGLSR